MGRRSNFIPLAIVYEWEQKKKKKRKGYKGECDESAASHYSWNIFFFGESICEFCYRSFLEIKT